MRFRNLRSRLCLLASLLLLFGSFVLPRSSAWAQTGSDPSPESTKEPAAPVEIPLDRWLVLGPVPAPLPAFHDEEGPSGKPVGVGDLLGTTLIEDPEIWPAAGDAVTWLEGRELIWRERIPREETGAVEPGEDGKVSEAPTVAWLTTYVSAARFVSAKLEVETPHRARVWLDGEQVAEKSELDTEDAEEIGSASVPVHLIPGKHRIRVKVLMEGAADTSSAASIVAARLELPPEVGEASPESVAVDASPRRSITFDDLLAVDTVTGLSVSGDGSLVAVEWAHPSVPSERRRSWVEIRRTRDGAPVRSFRGAPEISGFTWGPGRLYAYVSREDEEATVWVGEMGEEIRGGALRAVLRDVEHLGAVRFTPDSSSPRAGALIYEISEQPPEDDPRPAKGVQRMRSLQDRWRGWRTKTWLHQVSLAAGARRRLTAGGLSTQFQDLSPDGSRLLFSRTRYDSEERPFSVDELWELALSPDEPGVSPRAMGPRLLAEVTWMNAARYSPDGETILVRAGPSGFGELGWNVPEGEIANEYDRQLYLLDRDSGEARAITKDFDPSVRDAVWSRADGHVYLTAEDGSYVRLYRYRVADGAFTELATGVDVVDEMALSAEASILVLRGSSATAPERVLNLDLGLVDGGVSPGTLVPAAARYARVGFGRVEDRDFVMPAMKEGEPELRIPGRIYYPPGFDPERPEKWPLFVYYYGGTAPTDRGFGGRYPKNLWAAHGYVVYVLQPSGATGFGQEASARHVNDWGRRASKEILYGVATLLEERPYLDRDRVGCFGGSFGGFMTMLLISENDLFAAAIAHAGISSISSYWGEGWWGYLYSAVATAGSYPWNRSDIYVDQSPLFQADGINTPLLLLHGTADPNVPPGESEQMYTALRLLGKEVEYVKFEGEQHWILDEPKRRAWWQSILAWLDKHLKDQPRWWEQLWEGGGG